jgi:hypothetical protein
MKMFQVPRRAVDVQVLLRSGIELPGTLYAAASGPDGRPGRLGDRLNEDAERFVALRSGDDGCLLNKSWILMVQLDLAEEAQELEQTAAMREVQVRLKLAGGTVLEGRLPYSMPPGRGRLIDYLNEAPHFIPLICSDRLTMVNRDFVVKIRAVEGDGNPGE